MPPVAMRVGLAVLLLCLFARPSQAALTVCNRTAAATRVAVGFYDGLAWASRGWWTVPPKACRQVVTGPLVARYYYLHAADGSSGEWKGRYGFCVNVPADFLIRGRADCERRSYDRAGFFEIDTGQARDYTQTLSD
jgi:uncharacterized membrane protein